MVFTNTKKIILYKIIQENNPIEQPDLVEKMRQQVIYKNQHSARCGISKMINDLKNEDKITIKKIPTEGRGGMMTNVIYLK
jgi:hypothetical protein